MGLMVRDQVRYSLAARLVFLAVLFYETSLLPFWAAHHRSFRGSQSMCGFQRRACAFCCLFVCCDLLHTSCTLAKVSLTKSARKRALRTRIMGIVLSVQWHALSA